VKFLHRIIGENKEKGRGSEERKGGGDRAGASDLHCTLWLVQKKTTLGVKLVKVKTRVRKGAEPVMISRTVSGNRTKVCVKSHGILVCREKVRMGSREDLEIKM